MGAPAAAVAPAKDGAGEQADAWSGFKGGVRVRVMVRVCGTVRVRARVRVRVRVRGWLWLARAAVHRAARRPARTLDQPAPRGARG